MKGYIIGDKNNSTSIRGMNECASSMVVYKQKFTVEFIQQTSPETLKKDLNPFPGLKCYFPINTDSRVD